MQVPSSRSVLQQLALLAVLRPVLASTSLVAIAKQKAFLAHFTLAFAAAAAVAAASHLARAERAGAITSSVLS